MHEQGTLTRVWPCALLFPGWGREEDTHPLLPFPLRVFPDDGTEAVQENLAGVLKRERLEDVRN